MHPAHGKLAATGIQRQHAVTRDPRQAVPVSGTWDGEAEDFVAMDVEVDIRAAAPALLAA